MTATTACAAFTTGLVYRDFDATEQPYCQEA